MFGYGGSCVSTGARHHHLDRLALRCRGAAVRRRRLVAAGRRLGRLAGRVAGRRRRRPPPWSRRPRWPAVRASSSSSSPHAVASRANTANPPSAMRSRPRPDAPVTDLLIPTPPGLRGPTRTRARRTEIGRVRAGGLSSPRAGGGATRRRRRPARSGATVVALRFGGGGARRATVTLGGTHGPGPTDRADHRHRRRAARRARGRRPAGAAAGARPRHRRPVGAARRSCASTRC